MTFPKRLLPLRWLALCCWLSGLPQAVVRAAPAVSSLEYEEHDFWMKRLFQNTYFSGSPLGIGVTKYNSYLPELNPTALIGHHLYFKQGESYFLYQFPYDAPAEIDLDHPERFDKNKLQTHPHYIRGRAYKVPFTLHVFWELGKRFRLGIGVEMAWHHLGAFKLVRERRRFLEKAKIPDHSELGEYRPIQKNFYTKLYFMRFGYKLLDHPDYGGLILENRIGPLVHSPTFFTRDSALTEFYIGVGLTYERRINARATWFITTLFQTTQGLDFLLEPKPSPLALYGKMQGQCQAGATFNFMKRFPRCPIPSCHATTEHYHGGILYRP